MALAWVIFPASGIFAAPALAGARSIAAGAPGRAAIHAGLLPDTPRSGAMSAAARDRWAVAPSRPSAATARRGAISVAGGWIREAPPGAEVLAAYMEIRNAGPQDDHLLEARTPIAEVVSIHRTVVRGGVAKMEHLESIRIPARSTVHLRPGGDHLMIMFPERLPRRGEKVAMSLRFKRAGTLTLELPVRPDLVDLRPSPPWRPASG